MNSLIENNTPSPTVGILAIVSMSATLVAVNVNWPAPARPAYEMLDNYSSHPLAGHQHGLPALGEQINFAQEISEIYAALSEGQEPLGAEFEAIWDENVDSLYET
jgi:hypothetical protein